MELFRNFSGLGIFLIGCRLERDFMCVVICIFIYKE